MRVVEIAVIHQAAMINFLALRKKIYVVHSVVSGKGIVGGEVEARL